jgi:NAD(P)-dependent dehydrogenase (short-subunit alcohol dehydrogenase family)
MADVGKTGGYLQRLFGLDWKVALVTGATGGIGQELALGLAGAGAQVVVSGRREAQLAAIRDRIEAAGGSAGIVPFIEFFQTTREGAAKGVVRLDLAAERSQQPSHSQGGLSHDLE